MSDNPFKKIDGLDADYLESAYSGDTETAAMVFEQFLQELPANTALIEDSIAKQDVEAFRHHIHKQKPGYSYVGMTDVTEAFHDLQSKCITTSDMETHRNAIQKVMERIHAAPALLQKALTQLQNNQ
jgi:HPt (histidine-containing phosphotransfer) domain-containing protein